MAILLQFIIYSISISSGMMAGKNSQFPINLSVIFDFAWTIFKIAYLHSKIFMQMENSMPEVIEDEIFSVEKLFTFEMHRCHGK